MLITKYGRYDSMKDNYTNIHSDDREMKIKLFLEQKKTLDIFLSKGAISKAQYNKSYGDLVVLMGMEDIAESIKDN